MGRPADGWRPACECCQFRRQESMQVDLRSRRARRRLCICEQLVAQCGGRARSSNRGTEASRSVSSGLSSGSTADWSAEMPPDPRVRLGSGLPFHAVSASWRQTRQSHRCWGYLWTEVFGSPIRLSKCLAAVIISQELVECEQAETDDPQITIPRTRRGYRVQLRRIVTIPRHFTLNPSRRRYMRTIPVRKSL